MSNEEGGSYAVGWGPLPGENSRQRRDITATQTEAMWSQHLANDSKAKHRHKRGVDPIMSSASGRNRRKKKRLLASSKPRVYTVNDNALLPNGKIFGTIKP